MTIGEYDALEAIRLLQRFLKTADERSLNIVYQRIATEANNSDYGQELEPLQGICVAFQAELKRRVYEESQS